MREQQKLVIILVENSILIRRQKDRQKHTFTSLFISPPIFITIPFSKHARNERVHNNFIKYKNNTHFSKLNFNRLQRKWRSTEVLPQKSSVFNKKIHTHFYFFTSRSFSCVKLADKRGSSYFRHFLSLLQFSSSGVKNHYLKSRGKKEQESSRYRG